MSKGDGARDWLHEKPAPNRWQFSREKQNPQAHRVPLSKDQPMFSREESLSQTDWRGRGLDFAMAESQSSNGDRARRGFCGSGSHLVLTVLETNSPGLACSSVWREEAFCAGESDARIESQVFIHGQGSWPLGAFHRLVSDWNDCHPSPC